MVKRSLYESDYLTENKTLNKPQCLYCGANIYEGELKYCSEQCKEKDAVWHCEDSAV